MKIRALLRTYGLLAVLLASACAPAAPGRVEPLAGTPPNMPAATLAATAEPTIPENTPTPTLRPIATSRGPHLEASDPTTVRLASGGLQLVEFFRFT